MTPGRKPHRPTLVAIDLDGTLLRDDKSASEFSWRTLRTLSGAGVYIAFVTGRRARIAAPALTPVTFPTVAILNNGTVAQHWPGQTRIFTTYLSAHTLHHVIDCMRAVARPPVLLVEPAGSPADIVMDRALLHLPVYRRYAEQHAGFVVVEDNLSHSPLLTRVLGMFLCEPLDKINDLRAHLTDVLGDLIEHRSLDNLEYIPDHRILEILEPGHTKWNGIEQLCEALQLDDAYVIAFGDDHNDLDMLTGADLSFAPRNAIQAAKQAADDVIPSNNDDGVALTLRRLFAGIFA